MSVARVDAETNGIRDGGRRADARRNRSAILAATPAALRKNPAASVGDIAAEAGVGRMTLYGHFPSRAELIEAAVVDCLARGDAVLDRVPRGGDPAEAFARLIDASWELVDDAGALLQAAQHELPAERIRELHESSEARMRALLERGREAGTFRSDLPVGWMLTATHVIMNATAAEVAAGRLDRGDAAHAITALLGPAFASPTHRHQD